MEARTEDLQTLLELQHNDLELLHTRKQIDALPQRKVIVAARKKIAQVKEKQDQVAALRAEAEAKVARVSEEDERLAEKQRASQEAVDAAKGYRDVEAHAKEMNGYAKRRVTLEAELDELGAQLERIAGVEQQVSAALKQLADQEAAAVASFQKEGGALKSDEARSLAAHERLAATLPPDLRERYERAAEHAGGVAVAVLSEGRCGACRTPIEGGRLIDLKAHAPLGECPHCKRLLIVG